MINVFHGRKHICICAQQTTEKKAMIHVFSSVTRLDRVYKRFIKSKFRKLEIIGNEKNIWKAFRSLFTYIEASGGVVKNKKGKLLMIYRNRRWDLPKGKIERGEDPLLAAIREVKEECGISNLRVVRQLPSTHHIYYLKKKCLKRTYWYEMIYFKNEKPKPQVEEGIKKIRWMKKDEVRKIAHRIYPSLREMLTSVSFLSR